MAQEVVPDKELLNPAHALVKGHKNKRTAHLLAAAALWVVPSGDGARKAPAPSPKSRPTASAS